MTQWADEETTFYSTPEERRAAVADAERRGLTMKHDEYGVGAIVVEAQPAVAAVRADPDKDIEGAEAIAAVEEVRENRLTFGLRTDEVDPTVAQLKALRVKIADRSATHRELLEYTALRAGL